MTSTKRTADVDQSADTFAVCTTCSRLSCDLRICDKCGSSLTDDNAAHCYSSDPKRICTEALATSTSIASNTSVNAQTDTSRSFTNTVSTGVVDNAVRPQALYVNNQHFAGTSSSVGRSLTLSRPVLVASSNVSTVISSASHNGTTIASRGSSNSGNRLASTSSRQLVGSVSTGSTSIIQQRLEIAASASQITLPSYNLQPPPPPFAATVARLPGIVAGSVQAAVLPNTSGASHGTSAHSVQVNAVQIRIGSKKFKPSSAVTFKDDGILFTLKDYTYAPVLLNARAIVKCKANLSMFSYPVLFLFLENSCMRQIRNIFGLTANDFSYNSPVEMKRCISIFPFFGVEGKSQAQSVMSTIKRSFEAMVRRYPRSSSILEDISNDQAIDCLLELGGSDSVTRTESVSELSINESNGSQSNVSPVSSVSSNIRLDSSSMVTSAALPANQNQLQSAVTNGLKVTSSGASNLTTTVLTSHAVSSAIPQINRNHSSAPVLQIPNDQSRWNLMQKSLVANGVYHVLMPNGHRQYCLWNGKQLVPCFVQNTEVQLSCMRVRIGSLIAHSVGQIRIKADQSSGIHFTVKSDHSGTQEVAISPDDIQTCEVCFSNVAVIFLLLNNIGAEKVRKKLKIHANSDPAFDPAGPAHLQYILLFLNGVNRDQEEALMQMKFHRSSTDKPLIETIDISQAIKLLAQVKIGSTDETIITEFLTSRHMTGVLDFEKLVNDIASSVTVGSGAVPDDDDDVIMTQEEVGIKCPYTQLVMKNPVRNIICGHNYESVAIQEFIVRKKGNAKCPYAGCANLVPLRMEDLVENSQLRDYISKNATSVT